MRQLTFLRNIVLFSCSMWGTCALATNTNIDVTLPNGIVASNNPSTPQTGTHDYCVNQQPLSTMIHVQESTSGAGVAGPVQLTLSGPTTATFGPQNTDNAGVTTLSLSGLTVGNYSLNAQFQGTATHSSTQATGSVIIKDCAQSSPTPCCNRPQQVLQRCDDSAMKSVVNNCGADSLTSGMVSAVGGRYVEVAIDTDHPYVLYEIHWLAQNEPVNNVVKLGHILADCEGNTIELIKQINTYADLAGPPVNVLQKIKDAGYPDGQDGNFLFYSMGPYSYDETYKTDPSVCQSPTTLNTTGPGPSVRADGADTVQLANFASTSPSITAGNDVQFITDQVCTPGQQQQPQQPQQTQEPTDPNNPAPTGGSDCQSVVGTFNGHWGEAAFITDIAEDASGQMNGTYTLTNVGGDGNLGTTDDITHSGSLTGNHSAGSQTATIELTYTSGSATKTTSGSLKLVSDHEIDGNTVDFDNAPGTYMKAARSCGSSSSGSGSGSGSSIDPVTFQGNPQGCTDNGFVYCSSISDCFPAGYQCPAP